MTTEGDKLTPFHFDRHAPDYIDHFAEITHELHARCPIAWTETYGGHWVASGYKEVFEIARHGTLLSNDHDINGERKGYQGITIPGPPGRKTRAGSWRWIPPNSETGAGRIDPYLSPAAVARWKPMVEDLTRACIDDRIEEGTIDFVDDLANIVPAVITLAMMGLPLVDWVIYCEPAHATVYTPPQSPDMARVVAASMAMAARLAESIVEIRQNPRPGMVDGLITGNDLRSAGVGRRHQRHVVPADRRRASIPPPSLTAHSLEWLSQNPDRTRTAARRPAQPDRLGYRGVPALLHAGARRRAHRHRAITSCREGSSRRATGCTCRSPWRIGIRRCSPSPTP